MTATETPTIAPEVNEKVEPPSDDICHIGFTCAPNFNLCGRYTEFDGTWCEGSIDGSMTHCDYCGKKNCRDCFEVYDSSYPKCPRCGERL